MRRTLSNRSFVHPRTCDLLDGPGKPRARADNLEEDGEGEGADSDGGMVERFELTGVDCDLGRANGNQSEGDLEEVAMG